MKKLLTILLFTTTMASICLAQYGGGVVYGQNQGSGAQANERAKRILTQDDFPPSDSSTFLDASVLINVKADEYVAIFGVNKEGATLEECNQKMNATVGRFVDEIKRTGVAGKDVFVDFIAQNRIYGFEMVGDVAKEKLTGFELKKTVSIHFRDKAFVDWCIAIAARNQIFDLIKVDYIVKDIDSIHNKLMAAAAHVIKLKSANFQRLLGIKLHQPAQIFAERYSSYYPAEMYDSYNAFESEDVSTNYYRAKYTVQGARKSRTFYFNALNAKNFDQVINPVITEPVVQFTLYLKIKYESGLGKPAPAKKPKPAKTPSGRTR